MQSVNQPFVYNLKPLFAALRAVGAWSKWVVPSTWKKVAIEIELLNEHASWARFANYTPHNEYLATYEEKLSKREFQSEQLRFEQKSLDDFEEVGIKTAEFHTEIAATWGKFAPAWVPVKQATTTETVAVNAAIEEVAKNMPESADQAFHVFIEPLLNKIALAIAKTKLLSAVLEATWMMTRAWAATTIENIGNMATIEVSVQRKQTALSQMEKLFQIYSVTISEMRKVTSVAEDVILAAKHTASVTANMERVQGYVNVATMSTTEIEKTLTVIGRFQSESIPTFVSTCKATVQKLQALSYVTDSHIE
jgi:hypothetical protein